MAAEHAHDAIAAKNQDPPTAAEIANAAIVESLDISSRFFDERCGFLFGRVGTEVMCDMNAEPEIYKAHFADFLRSFGADAF